MSAMEKRGQTPHARDYRTAGRPETEYSPETNQAPERPQKRHLAEQQMEDRKRQRQEISKLQEFAAVTNPGTEEQGAPRNSEKRKVQSSERQQTQKKTRGSPANHEIGKRSEQPNRTKTNEGQKRKRQRGKQSKKHYHSKKDFKG